MAIVAVKKRKAKKQSTTQATTAVRQGPSNIVAAIAFERGKLDYLYFKPRPPTPTNGNCDEPKAMQFYGWMMARSDDVMKIIEEARALKLPEKKQDALVKKRTAALDSAHSPDGKDSGPIW